MAEGRKRRHKTRSRRQHERITYVATVVAVVTLICALLWASGLLDRFPPIVHIVGSALTGLICIVLLLPGVQTWFARRSEREDMEKWRK